MEAHGGSGPTQYPAGARLRPPPRLGLAFDSVIDAARAGSPWAFERIFDAFSAPVAGYLRAQGAADPNGTGNAVFLRVFSRLESFQGNEDRFRSWVFTIAHHLLIDERRAQGRRPTEVNLEEAGQVPTGGDVEHEALGALGGDWVRGLLERLAPDQRDVLVLRIVGDLGVDQVARAVGKSPGAVKALQRRGLATLRRLLEREGVSL